MSGVSGSQPKERQHECALQRPWCVHPVLARSGEICFAYPNESRESTTSPRGTRSTSTAPYPRNTTAPTHTGSERSLAPLCGPRPPAQPHSEPPTTAPRPSFALASEADRAAAQREKYMGDAEEIDAFVAAFDALHVQGVRVLSVPFRERCLCKALNGGLLVVGALPLDWACSGCKL